MGIQGLRKRYPRQLSSGQQQRTALARALSNDPELLLLDEPFSALDSMRRERLEFELLAMHDFYKGDILFVTHDLAQGYKLSSRIGVYESGHMVQCDSKQNVIFSPVNRTVASLTGFKNLMEGYIQVIEDKDIWIMIPQLGESLRVRRENTGDILVNQRVTIGIRPEHVSIVENSGENILLGTVERLVEEVTFITVRFRLDIQTAGERWIEITLPKSNGFDLQNGKKCYLRLPPEHFTIMTE
jgi:molybdate transport system ATP-binding protein